MLVQAKKALAKFPFFALILMAFNSNAQEQALPFHVQLFPFTDVHMHASLKPFNSRNVAKYNMLLQLNRRTEARILSLEFDPATAPASNPEYLKFKIVPKN